MFHFIFSALIASVCHADLITLNPGSRVIEGVPVSSGAAVNLEGRSYNLATTGAGLRRTKIFGPVAVKVYVGQMLVADPSRYVKTADGALPSIDNQPSIVMHLTFLRDVPSRKIVESFMDSISANHINDKDSDVSTFIQMIRAAGDIDAQGTITMFATKNVDGTETLAFDVKSNNNYFDHKVVTAGFTRKMASLWLGIPADEGLADLKSQLLQ